MVDATALVKVGAPTAEEMGSADEIGVEEYGGARVTVYRRTGDAAVAHRNWLNGYVTRNIRPDRFAAADDGRGA